MNRLTKTLLVFILASSHLGHASEHLEAHQQIQEVAEQFITSQFEDDGVTRQITANPIDSRARYAKCEQPLEASLPGKQRLSRNVTVQIRCRGTSSWTIYLPVRVKEMRKVVVAKQGLASGTVLHRQQLKIVYQENMLTRGGAMTDIDSVIGARLKRQVRVNDPILQQNLCVVCKGETVTIVAKADGFQIKANGVALSDASLGEKVRIRNSRSGQTLEARVTAVGVVIVAI
ncbi:flagellar basal body P-ring formation chaperone FlgA [Corallincola platygyrae]|uniref:Flagella basal body P-ring formation protein FlgA n=1 Tax=Corallincola platygyrae TaxID=1193278 RepID=A0ABW4XKS0_9GAMM